MSAWELALIAWGVGSLPAGLLVGRYLARRGKSERPLHITQHIYGGTES